MIDLEDIDRVAPVAVLAATRMASRPREPRNQHDFMRGVPGRPTATELHIRQQCENIRLGTIKRTLTGSYIWCRYVPGAEGSLFDAPPLFQSGRLV